MLPGVVPSSEEDAAYVALCPAAEKMRRSRRKQCVKLALSVLQRMRKGDSG